MIRHVTVIYDGQILVVELRDRNTQNWADGSVVARCSDKETAYKIAEALSR